MTDLIFPVLDGLSVLTLIGDILIFALLLSLITEKMTKKPTILSLFITHYTLVLMLLVALIATGGSLFLSEIAGWVPCKDCWLQRIFMYPQVILIGIAIWQRDRTIARYILALCIIGMFISIEHYSEQIHATFFASPTDALEPCDASGVSCAKVYTFRFGYITIPMMAFTAFALNALGALSLIRSNTKRKK